MTIRMTAHGATIGVLLATLASGCGGEQPGSSVEDIKHGVLAKYEHAEVGQLYVRKFDGTESGFCTGTLIGKRAVLTAAHCVGKQSRVLRNDESIDFSVGIPIPATAVNAPDPMELRKFRMPVQRVISYSTSPYWKWDLAVLQLDRDAIFSIDGRAVPIVPATIADSYPEVSLYDLVGYGGIGNDCADPEWNKYKVRTDYGVGVNEQCPGDSGAPYFLPNTKVVARVAIGSAAFYKRDVTGDATAARAWIRAHAAEAALGTMRTE